MAYYCHKCRNEIDLIITVGVKVGRFDECSHCGVYMHVCKNCRFYDPSVHNDCLENQAEFIRDREAANSCAHFEIKNRDTAPEADNSAMLAKSKLDDLFKNLK